MTKEFENNTINKKMNILLANDDGIDSPGLKALAKVLATIAHVYVAAPAEQKSGASNSISVGIPLRVKKVDFNNGVEAAWTIQGTPADCVKMALEVLAQEVQFDLLISGINYGPNLGTDVFYSGTVAAAFEGFILGLPAIAISCSSFDPYFNYELVGELCKNFSLWWQGQNFQPHTLFNINVPADFETADPKICFVPIGKRIYKDVFEPKYQQGLEADHYIMTGKPVDDLLNPETDVAKINQGYVTITPLGDDMTNHQVLKNLTGLELAGEIFK